MKRTKEEYQALWEETKQYYSNPDNIAYDVKTSGCRYLTSNGNKCAVGRCLTDEAFNLKSDGWSLIDSGNVYDLEMNANSIDFHLDDILKEQYKGFSIEFWELLQNWHDYTATAEINLRSSNIDYIALTEINIKDYINALPE